MSLWSLFYMDMTEMAKIQPTKLKSKSKLCVTPLLTILQTMIHLIGAHEKQLKLKMAKIQSGKLKLCVSAVVTI